MLDHVIVTVSNFTRSIGFYERALEPLGIRDLLDYKGQDGHPDLKGFGNDGRFFFWLKEGKARSGHRSLRFCRQKSRRGERLLCCCNCRQDGRRAAPAAQLEDHPDYYATWVLDPDGHDVEVVNKTGQID